MEKRIMVMECDQPGRHSGEIATVHFGLDGAEYATEMCVQHHLKFTNIMSKFRRAARKAVRKTRVPASADKEQRTYMRSRLRELGYDVPARGRLSADLMAKYESSLKWTQDGDLPERPADRLTKADLALVPPAPEPVVLSPGQHRVMEHVAAHGTKPAWRGAHLLIPGLVRKGFLIDDHTATDAGRSWLLLVEEHAAV